MLTGGGTVTLTGDDAKITAVGNHALTNVDNTIQGKGSVGGNEAIIINESLIDANLTGESLTLNPRSNGAGVVTFQNNATARASNGGTLVISGNGGGGGGYDDGCHSNDLLDIYVCDGLISIDGEIIG